MFSFVVPTGYPHDPPKVRCLTKVYHPNIDREGAVCLNILREDWKPVLTITAIVYGLNFLFLVRRAVRGQGGRGAGDFVRACACACMCTRGRGGRAGGRDWKWRCTVGRGDDAGPGQPWQRRGTCCRCCPSMTSATTCLPACLPHRRPPHAHAHSRLPSPTRAYTQPAPMLLLLLPPTRRRPTQTTR